MKKHSDRQNIFISGFLILMTCLTSLSKAQAPNPALIGYFQNWQDLNAPYVPLDQVDSRYNIIDIAFAIPHAGTDYKMEFVPDQVSQATFISQIQTLQGQGRKIIISIGGATAPISLDNIAERDTFITTITTIINTYGFDGIDIDFEGSSLSVSGGTISAPADQPIINLIDAIKQIMANFYATNNHRMILTMAPETAFVQGGQSAYGGIWGAYLPVINALRDSLEILHVQLYNSGSMFGIDGNIYTPGTADFIVAMCEAVIQGFNTTGGMFAGLPASKVALGLPACSMAAGGGFTDTATVKAAINYLRNNGPQPGSYTLLNASGYPDFRGMMTWSINWDAVATCGSVYEYSQNFQNIFGTATSITTDDNTGKLLSVFPNPANDFLDISISNHLNTPTTIRIYNMLGEIIYSKTVTNENQTINISDFPKGVYCLVFNNYRQQIIKQ
ncbi:MAG: glycosyl hydrolase family 18 protein [Bacteroidota bacterium]